MSVEVYCMKHHLAVHFCYYKGLEINTLLNEVQKKVTYEWANHLFIKYRWVKLNDDLWTSEFRCLISVNIILSSCFMCMAKMCLYFQPQYLNSEIKSDIWPLLCPGASESDFYLLRNYFSTSPPFLITCAGKNRHRWSLQFPFVSLLSSFLSLLLERNMLI